MRAVVTGIFAIFTFGVMLITLPAQGQQGDENTSRHVIDMGERPGLLIDGMDTSALKRKLESCQGQAVRRSRFSIGHRGAPLRFPEHTRESYEAAVRQGAGVVECDVTFTSDRQLVCRHSQCDLHSTTNILEIPDLAAHCTIPFSPYDATTGTPATARCCTSDISLAQFRRLRGRMDTVNPRATSVAEYLDDKPTWRGNPELVRGTLMTHAESIELFRQLGVAMTPELKSPAVDMPWQGDYRQQDFAQQMIDEYKQAGISPVDVRAQSFSLDDIRYWIDKNPRFGEQAIFLDSRVYANPSFVPGRSDFERLRAKGVRTIAPPMFALLELDAQGNIIPSDYARLARAAGLDIVTWTFERSDLREGARNEDGVARFYYRNIADAITKESDMYESLHVLARDVEVKAIFSDWPATVSYYASCMGMQ